MGGFGVCCVFVFVLGQSTPTTDVETVGTERSAPHILAEPTDPLVNLRSLVSSQSPLARYIQVKIWEL